VAVINIYYDISDFLEAGGPVIKLLLILGFLLWTMILERVFFYLFEVKNVRTQTLARWHSRDEFTSWYAGKIRQQFLAQATRRIRGPISTIKTFIALCPLFGLLGTVMGMIQVFEVMAILGTGNAREMASGVSAATLPTMAGMVLALSGMYPVAKFELIANRETRQIRDSMYSH
jgi:biopolymer transport protein ExbB